MSKTMKNPKSLEADTVIPVNIHKAKKKRK
jgi:hypothetical protein